MRLEQLLLSVTLMLVLSPAQLVAKTIDGSINLYEQPSLLMDEALTKAKEALGMEADKFVCTGAKSKKRAAGGGWGFFFKSITQDARYVEIDKSGKVVANNDAAPKGGQFKSAPSLSIEKAMAIATDTRDKPNRWFSLYADWREQSNEWRVSLMNAHRDQVYIYVDGKGNTREQKVPKQE